MKKYSREAVVSTQSTGVFVECHVNRMLPFDKQRFDQQLQTCLKQVSLVLANNRHPYFPADVAHKYEDKYLLATFLTNLALAALVNCLEFLGLSDEHLKKLCKWGTDRSVILRMISEERCSYDKEVVREVSSPTHQTGILGNLLSTKVVTKETDYHWNFSVNYQLLAFRGKDLADGISLMLRSGEHHIITATNISPKPSVSIIPPIDLNITWLLNNINEEGVLSFSINRNSPACHTPRRNPSIDGAFSFLKEFFAWSNSVRTYLVQVINLQQKLFNLKRQDFFNPVVPLFEVTKERDNNSKQKVLEDTNRYHHPEAFSFFRLWK
eukprot:TRINITY_DN7221_c0_g1_i2.p1 TRINITY_DN7221_c0_g1~~TRINITY_DN7221_c0_g1_i2.p1  ORF type:complete len:324 (-),score=60.62 TRINITY_DN7221_c0_g1_i2:1226-2197(-)